MCQLTLALDHSVSITGTALGGCGGFRVLNRRVGLGFYGRRATSLRTFKVFFFLKENNRISGGNRNCLQRQEIIRVPRLKIVVIVHDIMEFFI